MKRIQPVEISCQLPVLRKGSVLEQAVMLTRSRPLEAWTAKAKAWTAKAKAWSA